MARFFFVWGFSIEWCMYLSYFFKEKKKEAPIGEADFRGKAIIPLWSPNLEVLKRLWKGMIKITGIDSLGHLW